VNRALLIPGEWSMAVCSADGSATWAVEPIPVHPDDTGATLIETATLRGIEALASAFEAILAGAAPTPLERPLRGGRWRAQESFVLWERPGETIVRRVRACAGPWGGARSTIGETVVWLQDATLRASTTGDEWLPGTIVSVDDGIEVASGAGIVRVEWIRPAWRPLRRAGDWAREVGLGRGYQIG
jgi:methionyl-tRNA formyltransferase